MQRNATMSAGCVVRLSIEAFCDDTAGDTPVMPETGLHAHFFLSGHLDARRDWGHARDYVEGMWRILQQDVSDDYVLATGETHTVRSFVEKAFSEIEVTIEWQGVGVEEVGRCASTGSCTAR